MDKEMETKIYFNKYLVVSKIGEGSFGQIYSVQENKSGQNLLEEESYMLAYLKGGENNVLVMELLGPSLDDLLKKFKKFSLKTVCMLGIQMLNRIEFVHEKSVVHRDIKPDNFTIGLNENKKILYLIDFGLSKKYRSTKTLQHIELKNNKKLTGTARYASINALKGYEQSRRDDLESIGYVLIYLLKGCLPWQGLKVEKNEDRYKKIYLKKLNTTAEELCKNLPSNVDIILDEFTTFVEYTRKLEFEENPNYDFLRSLLISIMSNNSLEIDQIYDWDELKINESNDLNYSERFNHVKININVGSLPDSSAILKNDNPSLKIPNNRNYKFIESVNDKCKIISQKLKKSMHETNVNESRKSNQNFESFISNKSIHNLSTRNDNNQNGNGVKTEKSCIVI